MSDEREPHEDPGPPEPATQTPPPGDDAENAHAADGDEAIENAEGHS